MEKYETEVENLLLKVHGQFITIEHNQLIEKFNDELEKEGISHDEYDDAYQKLGEYYSQNYLENKEETDNKFVKEVIKDMKRLLEIASLIE